MVCCLSVQTHFNTTFSISNFLTSHGGIIPAYFLASSPQCASLLALPRPEHGSECLLVPGLSLLSSLVCGFAAYELGLISNVLI